MFLKCWSWKGLQTSRISLLSLHRALREWVVRSGIGQVASCGYPWELFAFPTIVQCSDSLAQVRDLTSLLLSPFLLTRIVQNSWAPLAFHFCIRLHALRLWPNEKMVYLWLVGRIDQPFLPSTVWSPIHKPWMGQREFFSGENPQGFSMKTGDSHFSLGPCFAVVKSCLMTTCV